MEKSYYNSPIGILEIICENNQLISLKPTDSKIIPDNETDFIKDVKTQLDEYFSGKRKIFDIDINPKGTDFQKSVWTELGKIPYGTTKSYTEIARGIGKQNAQRAVGNACNKNPIMIIIPCHRVISKGGKIEKYAYGNEMKKFLLNLEKKN